MALRLEHHAEHDQWKHSQQRGGGIYNTGKSTLADSTISGNRSLSTIFAGGGGIFNGYEMTVTNSTISGNQANFHGGGIDTRGMLTVKHSTITANRADTDGNGTGNGGGISVDAMVTNATIDHTIVAGNLRQVSTRSDVFGAVTARYSLVGDNTGATITNNGGNQIGTFSLPIDPLLGGLTDNVGPTRTHALLAFSPAIDAGELLFSPPPTNDQRGALFARVADGDGGGGARIDIGAYERQTLPPEFFVVDTLIDDDDGNYSPGDVSLREAIAATNGSAGADTITFAASLTSGGPATMLLLHGELAIGESLTISGPGAGLLTIDASGSSRVLNIDDGKSASLVDVEISGLTLTGGNAIGSGGAIFTRKT